MVVEFGVSTDPRQSKSNCNPFTNEDEEDYEEEEEGKGDTGEEDEEEAGGELGGEH